MVDQPPDDDIANFLKEEAGVLNISDLQVICDGLGSSLVEGGESVYLRGEEALECVQDLQRYLRRDDHKKRNAFHLISRWNVVQNDLLPLLTTSHEDQDLLFEILKLLVLLSMPILEDSERIPVQVDYLTKFRQVFLAPSHSDSGPFPVVMQTLLLRISNVGDTRSAADNVFAELVLTLLRNILAVPFTVSMEGENNLEWMWNRLNEEHVLETVVFLVQSVSDSENRSWSFLLAEIVYLLLRWISAESILSLDPPIEDEDIESLEDPLTKFKARQFRSRDQSTLLRSILENEKKSKEVSPASKVFLNNARHFTGAYITSHSDVLVPAFRPPGEQATAAHPAGALPQRKPRPRYKATRRFKANSLHESFVGAYSVGDEGLFGWGGSSFPPRLLDQVRAFVISFLDAGCYNSLLQCLDEDFANTRVRALDSDRRCWVWAIGFFTGVVRRVESEMRSVFLATGLIGGGDGDGKKKLSELAHRDIDASSLASTLRMGLFQDMIDYSSECVQNDDWPAVTLTFSTLHEILRILDLLNISELEANRRFAHLLLSYIREEDSLINLILPSLKSWMSTKQGVPLLIALVGLTHDFLNLLDGGGRSAEGSAEGSSSSSFRLVEFLQNNFATAHVVANYIYLLSLWLTNSKETNLQVVSFLHRIAIQCKRVPLLYQLSVFDLFHRIISHPSTHMGGDPRGVGGFVETIEFVMGSFVSDVGERPLLYVEMLFWKDSGLLSELCGGEAQSGTTTKKKWTPETESLLREALAEGSTLVELSRRLDRPVASISRKLRSLHLPIPLRSDPRHEMEVEAGRTLEALSLGEGSALEQQERPAMLSLAGIDLGIGDGMADWSNVMLWLCQTLERAMEWALDLPPLGEVEGGESPHYSIVPTSLSDSVSINRAKDILIHLAPDDDFDAEFGLGQHAWPRIDRRLLDQSAEESESESEMRVFVERVREASFGLD